MTSGRPKPDTAERSRATGLVSRWLRDRHSQILLAVILAGGGLRFSNLGLQAFDYEEVVVARIIHHDFVGTLISALHERTPPTYYLLAWAWSQLFGIQEAGLRSLSALIGTLTIPAAYAAGNALVSRRVGLIAAALVAVNPALVWYSQYARAYVLLVLFAALGLYFFARALREPTAGVLAGWAGMSILALASHYFAAFLVIPQGAYLLWIARSRRAVTTALAVVGAFGLALLPLIVFQASTHDLTEDYANRPIAGRFWRTLASFSAGPPAQLHQRTLVGNLEVVGTVSAVLALAFALVLLVRRADGGERYRALVVGGIGLIALLVPVPLAIWGFDYVVPRYYIATVVTLILLVGAGLGAKRSGPAGVIVASLLTLVLAGVVLANTLSPSTQLPPSRQVASAVGSAQGPRVLVVPKAFRKTLVYYLRAGHPSILRRGGHGVDSQAPSSRKLRVSEIVLVDPSLAFAPRIDGFKLTKRDHVDQYRIYVYRSDAVRTITIAALDSWRGGTGSVVLDRRQGHPLPVS